MNLGSYSNLPLSAARQAAKELRAKVALGHDVAGEKQERKTVALAKMEAARTMGKLADEHFERMVLGKREGPNIVRSRIEKDIRSNIGKLALKDSSRVTSTPCCRRSASATHRAMANDVLRRVRKMFDDAIKRHMVRFNPAAASTCRTPAARRSPATGHCHATS